MDSMRTHHFSRAVLLLALSIAPTSVLAQPRDTAAHEANVRFQEGRELLRQRKFAEARIKFLQACAADRTLNCPKNLGLAEHGLGLHPTAAGHLGEFLRHNDLPQNDPALVAVKKLYDDSFGKSGHFQVEAPPGAEIFADDASMGRMPLGDLLHVAPGAHEFRAVLLDGRVLAGSATVGAGETIKVRLMPPEPATTASTTATGTTAVPPPPPPPSPATSNSVAPSTPGYWNGRHVAGATIAGIAVASLGIAFAFDLVASSKGDDAATYRANHPGACGSPNASSCLQYTDITNSQNSALNAKHGFLIGGAALGVVGAVLLAWPRAESPASSRGAWVAPSLGVQGGGVRVGGRF
jgi:hypothetical protein